MNKRTAANQNPFPKMAGNTKNRPESFTKVAGNTKNRPESFTKTAGNTKNRPESFTKTAGNTKNRPESFAKTAGSKRVWLSSPYLVWVVGFTVIPMIMIFRYALDSGAGNVTFGNILAIFEPIHLKAMVFSLEIAVGCTLVCLLLAYPLVLAMERLHMGRRGFSLFIVILPMWMNFILRILAWQMILSNNGILNFILQAIGLEPAAIANTPAAIMIGMVYDYLPYMVLPIYNVITEIDADIIEAAKDLGAGSFTIFSKIIFPLSVPGLLSGIVMVFVPSMTSFVVADVLGGGKLQLIGNIIEQEFTKSSNWALGSGLSVSLMIFVLISMIFTTKRDSEEDRSAIW